MTADRTDHYPRCIAAAVLGITLAWATSIPAQAAGDPYCDFHVDGVHVSVNAKSEAPHVKIKLRNGRVYSGTGEHHHYDHYFQRSVQHRVKKVKADGYRCVRV